MTTSRTIGSMRRRRRLGALVAATALGAGAITGAVVAPASAAPLAVDDATFEWTVSQEIQSNPPFGGCNYLSAGFSDGTAATYLVSEGDVAIERFDGATPSHATRCTGVNTPGGFQKIVWSGGEGTVDPATGAASLAFEGTVSISFYGGLTPFSFTDITVTVDADGEGQVVGTLGGYASSMENPMVKELMDPVPNVVIADLGGADAGASGFTVTPDYAGVTYDAPEGGTPQNRSTTGWGSWPTSFVDFHVDSGLGSYWYTSGGGADPKKPPAPFTVSYTTDGGEEPPPEPGDGEQVISAVVPEDTGPGEFLWSIDGDQAVDLGTATDQGTYLQATGAIDPISVTDTRTGGPQWSISGQVSDFGAVDGKHLGWDPEVLSAGAGAVAGDVVASGIDSGDGLSVPSTLAAAPSGHAIGTASLGADLDLRLPVDTDPGTYTATLTLTALS